MFRIITGMPECDAAPASCRPGVSDKIIDEHHDPVTIVGFWPRGKCK